MFILVLSSNFYQAIWYLCSWTQIIKLQRYFIELCTDEWDNCMRWCLSVCLSTFVLVCMFGCLGCLSVSLPINQAVCQSDYLSVRLSLSLAIYQSGYLSLRLSICPSISKTVCVCLLVCLLPGCKYVRLTVSVSQSHCLSVYVWVCVCVLCVCVYVCVCVCKCVCVCVLCRLCVYVCFLQLIQ